MTFGCSKGLLLELATQTDKGVLRAVAGSKRETPALAQVHTWHSCHRDWGLAVFSRLLASVNPKDASQKCWATFQTRGTGAKEGGSPKGKTIAQARHLGNPCLWGWAGGITLTANLRTQTMDFRGLDSSRILIVRGGILMSIGNFPESLSQAILVGIISGSRLGVLGGHQLPARSTEAL